MELHPKWTERHTQSKDHEPEVYRVTAQNIFVLLREKVKMIFFIVAL
jgi:hypothetical protein